MATADTASKSYRVPHGKPGAVGFCGFLLLLMPGALTCPAAEPGKEIGIEKALATIESHERRAQSLRWSVECREGKVKDPSRPETANLGPVIHRGHVVIENFSGRYRVDLDSVMKWFQGADDHIAERNSWSFDGLVFRDLKYSKPGKELPRVPPQQGDDPGHGRIYRPGEEKSQFEAFRLTCGIGEMPPYHFGESLSGLIRKGQESKRPVRISVENQRWMISVPEREGDSTILVDYDPQKGAVLSATWQNGTPEKPWARIYYELQEVDGGLWVPKTMSRVNLFDKTIWQARFSDVKVNMATPIETFRLTFPPGVSVSDSLRKQPD
jgi:hypothetical protein